jgi:DNA-binding beta-propeller fold protein YncE
MKRILSLALSALILSAGTSAAQAYPSNLVELILEKKVMGAMQPGNRPVIRPAKLETLGFSSNSAPSTAAQAAGKSVSQAHSLLKNYRIIEQSSSFHSLVSVTDAKSGQEIHRISVGRRAQRILGNPGTNRLYVLCGGYFGSIWEIDTVNDVVVRKLGTMSPERGVAPLWNPQDMALLPTGNTLAVASGQLRLIDLSSGQVKTMLDLPEEAVEVKRLYPLSKQTLALVSRNKTGGMVYHTFDIASESFKKVGYLGAPRINPVITSLPAPKAYYKLPSVTRSGFVASRNSDFIHMVDLQDLRTAAIIPVDFSVDDLLLTSDRRRLFAYHRRFGQISVIELNPNSPNQFSVIQRIRDKRFQSTPEKPMYLAQSFDQVYLWDGYSQIKTSIDRHSLFVKMNVPFAVQLHMPGDQIWNSDPTHKRFYLKNGDLFMEYGKGGPTTLPARIETGGNIAALVMSPDRRKLYYLQPDQQKLIAMDAFSHQVIGELNVGKNPRSLSVSYKGDRLFVLNADEGSIQVVETQKLTPLKTLGLEIGIFQPQVIWVYDDKMAQLVQIELPRFLTDVARMVG